jgi:hypothetical protein
MEGAVAKRHVVKLAADERAELEKWMRRRRPDVRKLAHARALLLCDQGEDGPAWPDARVAEAVGCTTRSLESWRKRACAEGPLAFLQAKPPVRAVVRWLDGEAEAKLVRLACSRPPVGHARWSLRLLAARLVELEVVEAVSYETVRRAMKKTR